MSKQITNQEATKASYRAAETARKIAYRTNQKQDNNSAPPQDPNNQPSWLQSVANTIFGVLPSESPNPVDETPKVSENLVKTSQNTGPQEKEPNPTTNNINMSPEEAKANFTWGGLWNKLSNAVTRVFKAEETTSQADSLSSKSSSNSDINPSTEKQSPKESVAQEPSNPSILSKIRNSFTSLWRKNGAEQNKEVNQTVAQATEEVVISSIPPAAVVESATPKKQVSFGGKETRECERYLRDRIQFERVTTTPRTPGGKVHSVLTTINNTPSQSGRGG